MRSTMCSNRETFRTVARRENINRHSRESINLFDKMLWGCADPRLRLLVRHLPDFAAVRHIGKPGQEVAKIHDKHLGATEAYVDGLVEAIGDKDCCVRVRRVRDEVGHDPSLPVNAGYFITG